VKASTAGRALEPSPDQTEQRERPEKHQVRDVVCVLRARLGEKIDCSHTVQDAEDEEDDG
jgi:hypothetical protein